MKFTSVKINPLVSLSLVKVVRKDFEVDFTKSEETRNEENNQQSFTSTFLTNKVKVYWSET